MLELQVQMMVKKLSEEQSGRQKVERENEVRAAAGPLTQ